LFEGFLSRLFFGDKAAGGASPAGKNSASGKEEGEEKLTVADFDLLKIVGKGAFGKVACISRCNYFKSIVIQ
jgi:hypothetical protein